MALEVAPLVSLEEKHPIATTSALTTLGSLLSNHLVLCQTLPYLPPSAILSLAATSRNFRDLVYETPSAFRHLDLTQVKTARFDIDPIDSGRGLWHNTQLDEQLITEDEFYSGPLRGIFSNLGRINLLSSVHTLILDGLSVTAELVHDILTGPSFNVRILSLRDVKNLNERKLQQALQTACRPSRPDGTPRLKAVYIFSTSDGAPVSPCDGRLGAGGGSSALATATCAAGADEGDAWYGRRGKVFPQSISPEWAHTLLACRGVISFDAVLCAGPRHPNSPAFGRVPHVESAPGGAQWAVATHAVGGCSGCGDAPEGKTVWGRSRAERDGGPHDYPLLAPAPLHSSSVKAACCPSGASVEAREVIGSWGADTNCDGGGGNETGERPSFVARCFDCLKGRYCWSCNRWWCETCYAGAGHANDKAGVRKSCWECSDNCHDCITKTQLMCKSCWGGYCIIHNEGSNHTFCDWCSKGSRRTRELY